MKISPIVSGSMPGININGAALPAEAKAEGITVNPRAIKMKTNVSPDRNDTIQASPVVAESDKIDANEQTKTVTEETKPLSPQAAALAKQRRALQVKERELLDREKALESRSTGSGEDFITRLKSQPLSVLQEHGVTYDQLTEAILADSSNSEIHKLREEIKAIKDGVDKNLSDRDQQAEQQVLREIQKEAAQLAREGDTFELVREERAVPQVVRLIHETFKKHGEILDVTEAMQLVEDELLKDNLRRAGFKKIQSKLTPSQPQAQAPQHKQNQIKTLTNRNTSSAPVSRRERALLAFQGNLKRG